MYTVIYFNELNVIVSQDFDTLPKAQNFAQSLDWHKIVQISDSRTITDITE